MEKGSRGVEVEEEADLEKVSYLPSKFFRNPCSYFFQLLFKAFHKFFSYEDSTRHSDSSSHPKSSAQSSEYTTTTPVTEGVYIQRSTRAMVTHRRPKEPPVSSGRGPKNNSASS